MSRRRVGYFIRFRIGGEALRFWIREKRMRKYQQGHRFGRPARESAVRAIAWSRSMQDRVTLHAFRFRFALTLATVGSLREAPARSKSRSTVYARSHSAAWLNGLVRIWWLEIER